MLAERRNGRRTHHDGDDGLITTMAMTVRIFWFKLLKQIWPRSQIPHMTDKTQRRGIRDKCVKDFNKLAVQNGLIPLSSRPSGSEVERLFGELADALDADGSKELLETRQRWVDNGGAGTLPEQVSETDATAGNVETDLVEDGAIPAHKILETARTSSFRLQSKAFMLTFNSSEFETLSNLWDCS